MGVDIAKAALAAGHAVIATARNADTITTVLGKGDDLVGVELDVTDPAAAEKAVQAAVDRFGRIDVLVNNAGIGTAVPALHERPEDFRRVLDVNLMGAYWMAQSCAREMDPGSSIVNVASTLAFIASPAPQAAYAASKAGLIGLTRDLSAQWAGRKGIRVNALAPGYVQTEMTQDVPGEMLDFFIGARSPLNRMGDPAEITAAMLFLASPASGYVTGSTLAVDGGMSGH